MKRDNIIKLVLFLVIIVVIAAVILLINVLNTDKLENHSFYQYFMGNKYTYEASLKITRKYGVTELICKDMQVNLNSIPIYYVDVDNKIIFPEDMAIVLPTNNGLMRKVPRFAKIQREETTIYLEMGNDKRTIDKAFFFDGNDLYFFIEHTTIYVDDEEYELSPLSYVIVRYNEGVEIYNQSNDEYEVIETVDKNVTAKTDSYEIKLSIDALKREDEEQLLIRKIDMLQNLE